MKWYKILITITIYIFLQCASSEVFVRNDIDYSKYNRIAVFPLTDYPNRPGSGIQVADMLSMQLINSQYNIIDRSQTMHILQEQQLGMTGFIDESTAPSIGKVLGVQAILTGSISEYQCIQTNIQVVQGADPAYMPISKAAISLKLIDCETGQIVWAGSARGSEIGQNVENIAAQKAIKNILDKFKSLKINVNSPQITNKLTPVPTIPETFFPNLRRNYPKYNKFTDEQIILAFRKNNPQHNDKSDIWIIKYIEKKSKK
ncbi:MAG: CsgG/HfaB family protein [candidate division KSB1 bacterium]|nr:CsgG/HfaB family protein [candidate division KSB1 bacterium]